MEEPQTPGSDCNSNPATDSIQQDLVGSEFIQDNVEYQWFIDYGWLINVWIYFDDIMILF